MKNEMISWLVDLAGRSQVAEIEYCDSDTRIRVVTGLPPAAKDAGRTEQRAIATAAVALSAQVNSHMTHDIRVGTAGVFYRSPSPSEPPFVQVGDLIEEGSTVGILEAMKMLTPIEADRAGRITAILVEDGETIPAGTVVFRLGVDE